MTPSVAMVIPSLTGQVDALLGSLRGQTLQPDELEVVAGVHPSGRARNLGVARTRAPIVVFVDDDAVLGSDDTLRRLVEPLADAGIGVSGCAKLLPPASSRFARRVARQVPRIEHPVVTRTVESNPPVGRHGYTGVTTTCCAIRRDVLDRCGGFDEQLLRGVDSELFYRIRLAGYRLVLAADGWAWHGAPATAADVARKHFAYGVGYAQAVQKHRELAAGRFLRTPGHALGYLVIRTLGLVPHVFLPASRAQPRWRPGFTPLRALSSYAAAIGYVYGWYRHPYQRPGAHPL